MTRSLFSLITSTDIRPGEVELDLQIELVLGVVLTHEQLLALSDALDGQDFVAHLRRMLVREVEAVTGQGLHVPLYDSQSEAYDACDRLARLEWQGQRQPLNLYNPAYRLNWERLEAAWKDWEAWKRADAAAAQAGALD